MGCLFKMEIRRNFFSLKLVNLWNSLPLDVVEVSERLFFGVWTVNVKMRQEYGLEVKIRSTQRLYYGREILRS